MDAPNAVVHKGVVLIRCRVKVHLWDVGALYVKLRRAGLRGLVRHVKVVFTADALNVDVRVDALVVLPNDSL